MPRIVGGIGRLGLTQSRLQMRGGAESVVLPGGEYRQGE